MEQARVLGGGRASREAGRAGYTEAGPGHRHHSCATEGGDPGASEVSWLETLYSTSPMSVCPFGSIMCCCTYQQLTLSSLQSLLPLIGSYHTQLLTGIVVLSLREANMQNICSLSTIMASMI